MTRFARWRRTYNTSILEEKPETEPYNTLYGNYSKQKVCLKCRQPGHSLKNCPAGSDQNICYNCGSEEHTLKACPHQRSSDLKFAKCYVCNETGHLASQCPKNDKGIYPDGGCCRFCGSTRHLARHCSPTDKDPNAVMVSAVEVGQEKLVNPEDDYVFETLQKIQEDKVARKEERKKAKEDRKKSGSSKKVVKF